MDRPNELNVAIEEIANLNAENSALRDIISQLESENAQMANNLQVALAQIQLLNNDRTIPTII